MEDIYRILHDPSKNIVTKIDEQIDEFWQWSKLQKQVLEWEASYPNWNLIYTLFSQLIESIEFTKRDQKTINNLLYIIARDNEDEELISILSEKPLCLIFLAKKGLMYQDDSARWQFAHYLSKIIDAFPEVEEIILKYSNDHVEYVRRRALLALGIINSKYAEEKAIEAWNTNLEYQKLAAIEVLQQVQSKQIRLVLHSGQTDRFLSVRSAVEEIIRRENSE